MPRLHRARLALAVAASLTVVLSSPFVGEIRNAILAAFPSQFRLIIGGAIGVAVVIALALAIRRIASSAGSGFKRTFWRFTGLALAVGAAMLYARLVATGNLLVDVVEHVHFVEYGVLAVLFYGAYRPLDDGLVIIAPLLAGILAGIADETVQWFVPGRVGEAHDIFLNVVAVSCGLCFAASVDPPSSFGVPLERKVLRPAAYGISAVLLAFAAFMHAVHLGHQVYEPDIGVFWSHYDAPALLEASADRGARWRAAPPMQLHRLSREDEYLSEGFWHVQQRNLAWAAGDPFTAWRENVILERYFAPVLDTPSFISRVPPRWPAAQREQTAERVGGDPGIYISRAAPYPIYTWPKAAFWLAVAVVIAAVLTAC